MNKTGTIFHQYLGNNEAPLTSISCLFEGLDTIPTTQVGKVWINSEILQALITTYVGHCQDQIWVS